jgi:polygalacturonase
MTPKSLVHYPAPPTVPPSPDFALTVDGEDVFVYATDAGSVALIWTDHAVDVTIRPSFDFERVVVRPLSRAVGATVDGGVISLSVPPGTPAAPMFLSIELDDELRRPLFLFVHPAAPEPVSSDDENIIYLEGGRVHDLGRVELQDGQTLYIAGGAVLRGNVYAMEADHVAVRGRGVIDGSAHTRAEGNRERLIHLAGCDEVLVEGVTLLNGQTWQVMPAGCDHVTIRGIKIVSQANNDDGIDLVGCRDVIVEGCFIRTKDDCVAIKGIDTFHLRGGQPVEGILVQNSVFWNAEWGNALEIGYETRVDRMEDIVFRNCDVIRCEAERYGSGGVLTIHNGDRAVVADVLYEQIRVEVAEEKLIDFKILFDRYSRDDVRGQIHDVTVRDVEVVDGPRPVSILRGFDADHIPTDITLEDVVIHGRPVQTPNEAAMVTEKIRDVRFIVDGEVYPVKGD